MATAVLPYFLCTYEILSEDFLTSSCGSSVVAGQSSGLAAAADPYRFIHANAMPRNLLNVSRNVHRSHKHALHNPCGCINRHLDISIWRWRQWFISITCSNLLSACSPSMSGLASQDYMPELVLAGQCYTKAMVPNVECSIVGKPTRHHEDSCRLWFRSTDLSRSSCFSRDTVWSSWIRHPNVPALVLLLLS